MSISCFHAFTEIDAHYIWSNGDAVTEDAVTEPDWITTTATFTIINASSIDIGYEISGIVTRDDLTGIATDYAKDTNSNSRLFRSMQVCHKPSIAYQPRRSESNRPMLISKIVKSMDAGDQSDRSVDA